MKLFIVFIAGIFLSLDAAAQSLAGITGRPDTSYTNYSAFQGTRKTHPAIRLVPEQRYANVAEEKGLTYAEIGARKLIIDAFYPAQSIKKKRTAILIIHGGGWRSGNRMQHFPLAQRLASLGYACFTPEYRLSTEALFPAAVYDAKAAIRWVKRNALKYNIDTAKVVALGFSAGGELAAFIGATGNMPLFEGTNEIMPITGTNVDAVVDIDGILSFTHPESGEGDDSKRTSAATYWFGYPRKENEKLWEAASALSYAGRYTPPTLFLNSGVGRMHAGRSDYIRLLDQYHIMSEVHTFDEAPHAFCLFDPWFEPTVKYIDSFLKNLKM